MNGINWASRSKPTHLGSIAFQPGLQDNTMGERIDFQQMVLGHLDIYICKRMNLEPEYHIVYTKINSKWIKT